MSKSSNKIQKLSSVSALFLVLGFSLINGEKSSALEFRLLPADFVCSDTRGFHSSDSQNYYVGSCAGTVTSNNVSICPSGLGEEIRNFFLFDTEALSGNNLTSAILSLQNPEINVNIDNGLYPNPSTLSGFNSADGSENYQLRRIRGNTDLLVGNDYASGSALGQAIFNELGQRATYTNSPTVITNSDNGSFVNISLNQRAANDILSTQRKFAAGGSIESLNPPPSSQLESAFAFTNKSFRQIGTGAISNEPVSLTLEAGEITLNASDRGFYSETGYYLGNDSYIAGDCRGDLGQCSVDDFIDGTDLGGEQRNFFTFDLSSIDELIGNYDAFLRIEIPSTFTFGNGEPGQGFASTGSDSENYILADVTTPIDQLLTPDEDGGLPGTDIFADLGTGVFYSEEFTITNNDIGSTKEIPLNINALQDIVDSLGGMFAMSGAITTLNNNVGIADDEFAFAGTNAAFGLTGPDSVQLVFRNSAGGNGLSSNLSTPSALPFASAVASTSIADGSSIDLSTLNGAGISNEQITAINAQGNNSASTPEPTSLIGLLGLGALGFIGRNKKKNFV